MTDKLFDDFFKQKLEHHDSGAPMQVWEKVRRELHEDDDDKVIAWWRNPLWLLALLLVMGGTTTVIVGNNKGWFDIKTATAVNETKQNTIDDTVTPVNENNNTEKINPDYNNSADDNKLPAAGIDNLTDDNKTKNVSAISVKNNDDADNTSFVSVSRKKTKKKFRKTIAAGNTYNTVSLPDKFLNSAVSPDAITNNRDNDDAVNNPVLAYAEGLNKTSKNFFEMQKLSAAMPLGLKYMNNCPTIGPPRRNDLYIEVYGSPDNVTRTLSGTSFTPANYIDKRNDAEKNKVGFSAGIRIAKNIGERTLLKTGINYSQINEMLKYVNEKDIRIITVITIRTVTSGGQTITISDTTTVTQIGTTYTTFNNRYRTFDIPLIFSYEMGNPQKFSIGLNAGAIINLTSSYRGKILDTNLNPVSINTSSTLGVNGWRKNIGLGLYASISLYKRINNQVQLFFEPYTRINLKPVNVSETVIKQKYNTTGLQAGIRYNLFHKRQRYVE